MRDIEIPDGIGAVGYDESDIPDLVEGTMKQQRLLATAPKRVTEDDIAGIYRARSACGEPAVATTTCAPQGLRHARADAQALRTRRARDRRLESAE